MREGGVQDEAEKGEGLVEKMTRWDERKRRARDERGPFILCT